VLAGCFSLDPFLFSGQKLGSYSFDSYTGKRECTDAPDSISALENAGAIANKYSPSYIHQYSLASGGEQMAAVLVSPDTMLAPQDTLIVYFHGKSAHLDYYWPRVRLLFAAGYPVFALDYQGFGMSTGSTTEQGLFNNARTAMDFIKQKLGDPKVIVYGFSLGSIPATEMVSNDTSRQVIKFILEAPIHSIATLTDNGSYLDLPSSYLSTYTSDNAEKIKKVFMPLFWLHGTHDETLERSTNGLPIWNNYPGAEGYYVEVSGGGHANLPTVIGYGRYIGFVNDFIRGIHNPLFTAK
jgi:pimeloyl-ACP methyl ester carboxylesterase